jgi:hypothetical protein
MSILGASTWRLLLSSARVAPATVIFSWWPPAATSNLFSLKITSGYRMGILMGLLDILEDAGALVALALTIGCIAVWSVILVG